MGIRFSVSLMVVLIPMLMRAEIQKHPQHSHSHQRSIHQPNYVFPGMVSRLFESSLRSPSEPSPSNFPPTFNITRRGDDTLFLNTSVLHEEWDTLGKHWFNYGYYTYTYNEHGNQITTLNQFWDGSSWVNENQQIYTFDSTGLQKERLSQEWNANQWSDISKTIYYYTENRNFSGWLSQEWNNGEWVNERMATYTYDETNSQREVLFQSWNDSQWTNDMKWLDTYDSIGVVIEWLSQTWYNNMWINYALTSFTYNDVWNTTGQQTQTWNDSNWVNSYKYTYTYNSHRSWIEILEETWQESVWVNAFLWSSKYNEHDYWIEDLGQIWNGSNWINYVRYTYTWEMYIMGINEQSALPPTFSLMQNYPNPFNPATHFKFRIADFGLVTLKIYNILGHEVATVVNEKLAPGDYTKHWDATDLPGGVYYYRLQTGGKYEIKKLLIVK